MTEVPTMYGDDAGAQRSPPVPDLPVSASQPRVDAAGLYIVPPERWIVLGVDVDAAAPLVAPE